MELVRLESLAPLGWPRPALTVGNFDGVHLGHQALAAVAVRDARAMGGVAVVLTFHPHPSRVLAPDRAPRALMTVEQKAEVLGALGIDRLAILPFTRELSLETPETFARLVLREALGASVVVVGAGFRFGHRRAGDVRALESCGQSMEFRVHAMEPILHEGAPISSTRIREALARGDVEAARDQLGRPFRVDGTVVRGDGRGRSLGIPTANLRPENEMLPGSGVYACRCGSGGTAAVVNIGRRPTFGGGATVLEAHLLDFEGDLYGTRLRVEFIAQLREERRFPGPEALVAQIREDIAAARVVVAQP